jgi:hypothetical protein
MFGLLEPGSRFSNGCASPEWPKVRGFHARAHRSVNDRQRLAATAVDERHQGTNWSAPQSTGEVRGSPSKS